MEKTALDWVKESQTLIILALVLIVIWKGAPPVWREIKKFLDARDARHDAERKENEARHRKEREDADHRYLAAQADADERAKTSQAVAVDAVLARLEASQDVSERTLEVAGKLADTAGFKLPEDWQGQLDRDAARRAEKDKDGDE